MIFINENEFENENIAIIGGFVDNFGRKYENQFSNQFGSPA